ncbi:diaminopimelate decarboxylase [Pedobacter cryoconitis]|uniref:Diaminopimelate decarboxylase n=1 Tax=Pedobacter cryoconitis TaxID=188932 RepID=A0A7W8YP93_9SPHI|nr:diaminopimelate decarboxylase [Pedobacter cryoconitis]MBB5619280.1 diaminopimelate decarboxylase [Pedobacter cryoconitis]MBB5644575.1 diaminopimelate decarboxylase [Pedobacter cryoconitis]
MFSNKDIAQFADLETPFYYYDLSLLQRSLSACVEAAKVYDFHVHYAMKANFNDTLLKKIKEAGLGADCVSGNEVKKAVEIGFDKKQVVFAGVGKSDREINEALDLDIFCFNVESVQELEVINALAGKRGKVAKVAIRINPNVDAHTHHNITTGLDENKFGVNSWDLPACAEVLKASANLEFIGIHFHIGSQITNLDVFKNLCVRINEFAKWFEERGFLVKVLNVGGGLGIDYQNPEQQIPDFVAYFKIFNDFLEKRPNQEVHFELGRAIVGQCSSLVSRVLYVKNGKSKNFIILDAGMTELMRPALYQAYHQIENLSKQDGEASVKYDVVGPICESTDCFGKEVLLQETERGDLVAIRSTGAYGEVMSSHYNLRENVRVAFSE